MKYPTVRIEVSRTTGPDGGLLRRPPGGCGTALLSADEYDIVAEMVATKFLR